MDSKRFFTSMLFAGAIMLLFMWWRGSGTPPAAVLPYPIYVNLPAASTAGEWGAKPETVTLGGGTGKLAVVIDNVTAGIDSVQFNVKEYADTYERTKPLTLFEDNPKLGKPFSTVGIHITLGDSRKEYPLGSIQTKNPDGTTVSRAATLDDSAENISIANSTNLLACKYLWQIDKKLGNATDVVLFANFMAKGSPLARVTKTFHIDPASYEITITHTVENLTGRTSAECNITVNPDSPAAGALPAQEIHVRINQLSTPALKRDDIQTDDRFFHAAFLNTATAGKPYVDNKNTYNMVWGSLRKSAIALKDDKTGRPKEAGTEYMGGLDAQMADFAHDPMLWVASSNRFFAVIVRPLPETDNLATSTLASGQGIGNKIPQPGHINSANIDLMQIDTSSKASNDAAIIRLTGHTINIPAGKSVAEPLSVYMGPKKREIFQGETAAAGTADYATFEYSKMVQYSTCMVYPGWLIDPVVLVILKSLDFLKGNIAFGNYGVAIMILVIVVRALLHPLTRSSQINMAKMGKQMRDVAPQMAAMKKRYPDDKKKQSEETMRIYRENKINPAGSIMGCLPMLIQAPIWAALYSGLRADIDLRHAAFIPGWINDLASADTVFPPGIPVVGHALFPYTFWMVGDIYGLNLLPILVTAVFFIQMKVTTATQPKPADEQQAQMQKMSQYMIFIFPLMLYNAPSGLNLYIFASTMAGLLDMYLVRKALRKQGILASNAPLLPTHEVKDDEKK